MRRLLRGSGDLLITAGLVLALFCAFILWGTNRITNGEQDHLRDRLRTSWANGGPGFVIHVPKFGDHWSRVVVEGTGVPDLKKGPGHYIGSAKPGEIGNVAIAGHRTTYGAPFNKNDTLNLNDFIILETKDRFVVYKVTSKQVVFPSQIGVVLPVPDHPGVKATKAMITLTTCHPKYSARQRLVVHGLAHSVWMKKDLDRNHLPNALKGI